MKKIMVTYEEYEYFHEQFYDDVEESFENDKDKAFIDSSWAFGYMYEYLNQ